MSANSISDKELICKYLEGNQLSLEKLVRRHQSKVFAYILMIVKDKQLADDLFQETMLTAWKRLSEFDRTRPFGPWLRGIAARLVMAHYRKAKRSFLIGGDEMLEYVSQQIEHISARPGDTWEEKIEGLVHCIEALPDRYRQPIRLRYFEDRPAREIAGMSETSLEAVKKRLQRARSMLLDCLRRQGMIKDEARTENVGPSSSSRPPSAPSWTGDEDEH